MFFKHLSRAAAIALCAATPHLRAATPEAAMNAAIVPGADLHAEYKNLAKIYASPVYKQILAVTERYMQFMQEMMKNAGQDMPFDFDFKAVMALGDKHNLGVENYDGCVYSLAINPFIARCVALAKDGGDITHIDDLRVLFACSFHKPVTKENLRGYFNELVAFGVKLAKSMEVDTEEIEKFLAEAPEHIGVTDFTHGGATGFNITPKPDEDDRKDFPLEKIPVLSIALLADGKALFIGLEDEVKAAIDRANAGEKAEPSPALKKLLDAPLGGKPLAAREEVFAYVVPQLFRDFLTDVTKDLKDEDLPLPGLKPAINAAKNLQGFRGFGEYGDKMDCVMSFAFDTPERAVEVRDFLQINVLNMAKMFLFQLVGKNTAFAESLAAAAEGDSASIALSLSGDDLNLFFDTFKKYIEKMRAQFRDTFPPGLREPAPFFVDEDDDE